MKFEEVGGGGENDRDDGGDDNNDNGIEKDPTSADLRRILGVIEKQDANQVAADTLDELEAVVMRQKPKDVDHHRWEELNNVVVRAGFPLSGEEKRDIEDAIGDVLDI
ncbi:hypothetical protein HY417_03685 [Candidatus Kaiserbacteria bacterium]|nr:hypothetical protein [Candidatus Kaiserbacteria bacterium]